MEELPNLVAGPLEVAKFVDLLFTHLNPDVLFLRGIRTMFMGNNYIQGLKLLEEAMEARKAKVKCMFCMLELLKGSNLESNNVERVFKYLGPLKENENMVWIRSTTIRQFSHEWSDEWELNLKADGWLKCHGRCQLTEVPSLNPKYAIDYYDEDLCMYCRTNRKMAFLYIS